MDVLEIFRLRDINKSLKKYLNKTNVSLAKVLLIFYLIIANNFTKDLYSGQLSQYISNNRGIQHVIGFITMMVLVSEFGGIKEPSETIMYSLITYLWFLLSTKIDLHWSLAIIAILTVGYLYENKMEIKEHDMVDDEALEEEDIKKITKKIHKHKRYMLSVVFVLILMGLLYYFSRKREEYAEDFDTVVFVFGPGKKNNQMM